MNRNRALGLVAACLCLSTLPPVLASEAAKPAAPEAIGADCSLLDDTKSAGKMDGLLFYLARRCGREAEFIGGVRQEPDEAPAFGMPEAVDAPVSNPAQDPSGTARTQSETSIAFNPTTGTLCAAWNDSYHGVTQSVGFSGFGRSTDGGATWTDYGAVAPTGNFDTGDPSLVWRKVDGKFYYAALKGGGLGVYRSDDDCQSFTFVANIATGSDDKEIMAVDNNVGSPFYGRLYVVWTDFGAGGQIVSTYSTNAGATWSAQVALTAGQDVQGAWPAIAPNGDVFVTWVRWNPWPSGNIDAPVSRSTNGGVSYTPVTNAMTNQVNPRDNTATSSCGRPSLKGNMRYLPNPTIAVDGSGVLHIVYSYDPDGNGTGDVVNVYYRRSTDNGATWGTEVQINDDATLTDQYQPSLSVGEGNVVAIGYYSKQNNADNLHLDYYSRVSYDAGVTWQPSTRLSDVSSAIVIDPNLATCYHGDYDTQIHHPGKAQYLWSDDRGGVPPSGSGPDIYNESTPAGVDFLVVPSVAAQSICAGASPVYPLDVFQFQGFSNPVDLSATGNPGATTVNFSVDPVTPPGSSNMTIGNTGAVGAGVYPITVTGTANAGAIVHSTQVTLEVFNATAGVPGLTSPANGAIDVVLVPTYTWGAATQAQSYDIEVASDAGFTSIVYSAAGLSGTSYTPASALAPLTQYFWHVRANNLCGTSAYSSTYSFTTRAIPPTLLVDDDNDSPDNLAAFTTWLTAAGEAYDVLNTNASANEPALADLLPYQRVIWWSGDAFGSTAGPGAAAETALASWLDTNLGKCLFLDSQDYLYDFGITAFGTSYLGIAARTNDVTQTQVTGKNFFTTPTYVLSFPANFSNYSDSVTPGAGALVAFNGNLGTPPSTSIYKDNDTWRTVFFTTPLEAFPAANQQAVFQRVLDFCDALFQDGFDTGSSTRWSQTFP